MKKVFFDSSLEANSYDFPEFKLFLACLYVIFQQNEKVFDRHYCKLLGEFCKLFLTKNYLFMVDHCTHVSAYSFYTFNFYKSSLCRLKAKKQMQVVYFL